MDHIVLKIERETTTVYVHIDDQLKCAVSVLDGRRRLFKKIKYKTETAPAITFRNTIVVVRRPLTQV